MRRTLAVALALGGILAGATTSVAYAQATRTWVSGVGDDVNPCSRTAPCKTFAGAISKTAAGGEIDALDPGGFGTLTITKSITIDGGGGVVASALAGTGVTGFIVNAGVNDVVILRNLSINGAGGGLDGVRFINGKQLIIEHTSIFGFTRNGVLVQSMTSTGAEGQLEIRDSKISDTNNGALDGDGIRVSYGSALISHSVISGSADIGILSENGADVSIDGSLISFNGRGAQAGNGSAGQSATTLRISNNDVYGNLTAFGCGTGVLASNGTNRKANNGAGGCSPNATITMQ